MTDNVNMKDKNDLNVFPFLLLCRLTDAQTEFQTEYDVRGKTATEKSKVT